MKISDIRPLSGYALLKEVRTNASIIHMPDNAGTQIRQWVIICAGARLLESGELVAAEVHPGDAIKFGTNNATLMPIETEEGRVYLAQQNEFAVVVGRMSLEDALSAEPIRKLELVLGA